MKSYKEHWTRLIARELAGYEELSLDDPFDNWGRLVNPEVRVELPFGEALELTCGEANRELVSVFLDKALALANRMLAEKIYERKACKDNFPLNRSRILRVQTYATWLRHGQLNLEGIRNSIEDLLVWSREIHGEDWNEFHQSYFISGLSMSLLADRALTDIVMRSAHKCPNRAKQLDILNRAAWTYRKDKNAKALPLNEYDDCFDEVRQPDRAQKISSFEMGYVRLLVYSQQDGRFDPWEAVRLMSR